MSHSAETVGKRSDGLDLARVENMLVHDFNFKQHGFVGKMYDVGGEKLLIVIQGLKGLELPCKYAKLFAEKGYSALAMSYYGSEGLPRKMRAIPLEMFGAAIGEMKKRGFRKFGIYGNSKGGGIALIAASQIPDFSLCIAVSATAHIFQGNGKVRENPCRSMVSYHGKDFPYIANKGLFRRFLKRCLHERKLQILYLIDEWEKFGSSENEIPVEHIRGEILLLTAEHDESVPARADAELLMKRLEENHFAYPHRHVNSKTGSHNLGYYPVNNWVLPREKHYPKECQQAREDTLKVILETLHHF